MIRNVQAPSTITQVTREKRWLTPSEMRQLIQSAQTLAISSPNMSSRDNALLRLMVTLGISREELSSLEWDDISYEEMTKEHSLLIKKNGKARTVRLPYTTYQALMEWKRCCRSSNNSTPISTRIFKGDIVTTEGITDRAIWLIVQKCATSAGIGHISPEVLRRSFARNAYDVGVSIEEIKVALGHATLASTEKLIESIKRSKIPLDVWANLLDE